jgi:hypothetical protein
VDVFRYFGLIALDLRRDLSADVLDILSVHYLHIDLDFALLVPVEFDARDVRDPLQLGSMPLARFLSRLHFRWVIRRSYNLEGRTCRAGSAQSSHVDRGAMDFSGSGPEQNRCITACARF